MIALEQMSTIIVKWTASRVNNRELYNANPNIDITEYLDLRIPRHKPTQHVTKTSQSDLDQKQPGHQLDQIQFREQNFRFAAS